MRPRTVPLVLLLVLAAIGPAACGGDDASGPTGDVRANGTDVAFVDAILPHHERAVDVADLALSRTDRRPLERLAEEIIQIQSVELATLRTVRDVLQEAGVEQGELGVDAAAPEADLGELRNASDFDCAFLETMIPHTEVAIRFARAELESGIHAELRRMSENIIDAQGFEQRQMRRFQRRWCSA